jgi:hypothetical protein
MNVLEVPVISTQSPLFLASPKLGRLDRDATTSFRSPTKCPISRM